MAYRAFTSGETYTHRATETVRAASLIKLPLLVHALSEVARGGLRLEQRLPLSPDDQVGGAGVLHRLQGGLEPSLQDLLTLMIIVSDNTATNLVIDLLGLGSANAFIQSLGMQQTRLVGKLQLPLEKQNEAQRRGEANATCAADVLGLLLQLQRGDLLPPELTDLALTILKQQQYTEALARYLPTDKELFENYVTVASKSGCLRGLWHDAGIVFAPDGTPLYALVVMTEGSRDTSYSWEQEGMLLIAEVSREVHTRYQAQR